jgi:adenylyltransferase/sulfurtransferase
MSEHSDGETEITALELAEKMKSPNPPFLVDVREWEEYQLCSIPDSTLIPLDSLSAQYQALDPNRDTVCICKVGMRSKRAQQILKRKGFKRVWNLAGGIVAWQRDVDPSMVEY